VFGDPETVRAKRRITEAVRGRSSTSDAAGEDPRTVRLVLRQLEHTDGDNATLRTWHAAYPEEAGTPTAQDGAPPSHPDAH
jgi:hypothetical protein